MERERKKEKNFDRRGLKTALVSLCLISHADGWRCFSSFPHSIMEGTRRERERKRRRRNGTTQRISGQPVSASLFFTPLTRHTHTKGAKAHLGLRVLGVGYYPTCLTSSRPRTVSLCFREFQQHSQHSASFMFLFSVCFCFCFFHRRPTQYIRRHGHESYGFRDAFPAIKY